MPLASPTIEVNGRDLAVAFGPLGDTIFPTPYTRYEANHSLGSLCEIFVHQTHRTTCCHLDSDLLVCTVRVIVEE